MKQFPLSQAGDIFAPLGIVVNRRRTTTSEEKALLIYHVFFLLGIRFFVFHAFGCSHVECISQ